MRGASRFLLPAALLWTMAAPAGPVPAVPAHAGALAAGNADAGGIRPRDRDLPNLRPFRPEGWDFSLVPRDNGDATITSVHLTPLLTGAQLSTYWNAAILNDGDAPTDEPFLWRIYVDDSDSYLDLSYTNSSLPPAWGVYSLNRGPCLVHGGRHTFEIRIDDSHVITESNEIDNDLAYQFIWTPLTLNYGTYSPPPDPTGGWGSVPAGEVLWYNCEAMRITASGWWNAVWISPQSSDADYDCRLHEVATGCRDGFAANLGWSSRPAGHIDGLLANRNTMAQGEWDVGILNMNGADASVYVSRTESTPASFGYPVPYEMAYGQMIKLMEYMLTYTGWCMFELEAPTSMDGLVLNYYDDTFTTGSIDDHDYSLSTEAGFGRGFHEITAPGYHCLAVCRDMDLGDTGFPFTLTFTIGRPDFTPRTPSGWHSPCVPRPDASGTPSGVSLPDTLYGNSATTYPNLAMRNATPVPYPDPIPYMKMHWEYDERPLSWVGFNPIDGYDTIEWNGTSPATIPGGRHTYALLIDRDDEIVEVDETNNDYGEQYCWSPTELTSGTVTMRPMPALGYAGWDLVGGTEPLWYNCDGLRLPRESTYWLAMAVLPVDPLADVDVSLHEALTGVKDGFAEYLATSVYARGESDYVIVNFNRTSRRAFDTGVVTLTGDGNYRAHAAKEEYLANYPSGTYGPFSMSSLALLRLHEMSLREGEYLIRLDQQAGNADLGLTLHRNDEAYQWKYEHVLGGYADFAGPGQDEEITVTIPATDYYCLAIWKAGSADLNLTSTYELEIVPLATAVPGEPEVPVATRLTGVFPNPFNPQTSIAFDLAREEMVVLDVHDVLGKRIRRLVADRLPPGRHRAQWDGRDEDGQPVASGVYVARLVAGPVSGLEKMVLVR
jgi:hypothetical protein